MACGAVLRAFVPDIVAGIKCGYETFALVEDKSYAHSKYTTGSAKGARLKLV